MTSNNQNTTQEWQKGFCPSYEIERTLCQQNPGSFSSSNLVVSLASAKKLYMTELDSRKKLGGEEFSQKYRDQLLTEIDESLTHYEAHSDSKNIFKAANTPITLFVMWSVLYIFGQLSSLLMLYPFANIANLLMWGLILLGATWAHAKYSGEFSQVGVQIEELTGTVWDNCFQTILNKAVEQGGEIAVRQAVTRLNPVGAPYPETKKKL